MHEWKTRLNKDIDFNSDCNSDEKPPVDIQQIEKQMPALQLKMATTWDSSPLLRHLDKTTRL